MKKKLVFRLFHLAFLSVFFQGLIFCPSLSAQNPTGSERNLLITFKQGITQEEKANIKAMLTARLNQRSDTSEFEIWSIPKELNISNHTYKSGEAIIDLLKRTKGILDIEEDYSYNIQKTPNDPLINKQWGIHNEGQGRGLRGADINVFEAWEVHTGGDDIVAGIVDSGIDYSHEDLAENIWQNLAEDADGDGHTLEYINGKWELDPGDLNGIDDDRNGYSDDLIGWDFINNDNNPMDDNGHGTHVAGIISAKGNNRKGIAGINWSGKLMALKAFDEKGDGALSSILPALKYARKMGAHFTNNSWGGASYSKLMLNEIKAASRNGQLLIAAAGNTGDNNFHNPIYPASYDADNIISVAATDRFDQLASFSNFGSQKVHIAAPGQEILSTLPGNKYGVKSGTSMAAPFVAGAISLIWSYTPGMDHQQIKNIILSSVDVLTSLAGKTSSSGRLNLLTAMQTSTEVCTEWVNYFQDFKIKDFAEEGNYIWAATNEGLMHINKEDCSYVVYNKDNSGLYDNDLVSVAIDHDGVVWIGSDEEGVYSFDGKNWRTYLEDNSGLPDDEILSILVDSFNRKWIGTYTRGIAIFDNNTWQFINKNNSGLPHDKISCLTKDRQGNIWACTKKGIAKYKDSAWEVYKERNSGIPDNITYALAFRESGEFWVATKKGVGRFDGNSWKTFNKENSGLPEDEVYSIEIDKNDNVWLATEKGAVRYKQSRWNLFKESNSPLPNDEVNSLLVDKINNLWLGTNKGIQVFTTDVVASFTGNSNPCLNQSNSFINTSVRGLAYEWKVDGRKVSTQRDLNYKFDRPGTYDIQLRAINNISEDVFTQKIRVEPFPNIDLGPNLSMCAEAVILDACRDDLIYEWFDGQGIEVGNQRTFSATETGYYVVTGEDGCGNIVQNTIFVELESGCMKPGDSNADGKVNIIDFLLLGQVDGMTGPARNTSQQSSSTQVSEDWLTSFSPDNPLASEINHKHADANGDGLLELFADGNVIKQNANEPHETIINNSLSGAYIKLNHLGTNILSGDSVRVFYDVLIENKSSSAPEIQDAYGVAFSLDFNMPVTQAPTLETGNSWLGEVDQLIIQEYTADSYSNCQRKSYSQIDIGLTRTEGIGATGSGSIGTLGIIIVIDDLAEEDLLQDFASFSTTLRNPIVTNTQGEFILSDNGINSLSTIVPIKIPKKIEIEEPGPPKEINIEQHSYLQVALWHDFDLYPNPSNNSVSLSFKLQEPDEMKIRIRNLTGTVVHSDNFELETGSYQHKIMLDDLPAGMYLVELGNATESHIKKLIKLE